MAVTPARTRSNATISAAFLALALSSLAVTLLEEGGRREEVLLLLRPGGGGGCGDDGGGDVPSGLPLLEEEEEGEEEGGEGVMDLKYSRISSKKSSSCCPPPPPLLPRFAPSPFPLIFSPLAGPLPVLVLLLLLLLLLLSALLLLLVRGAKICVQYPPSSSSSPLPSLCFPIFLSVAAAAATARLRLLSLVAAAARLPSPPPPPPPPPSPPPLTVPYQLLVGLSFLHDDDDGVELRWDSTKRGRCKTARVRKAVSRSRKRRTQGRTRVPLIIACIMDARFASVLTVRALGLTTHLDVGVLLRGLSLPVHGLGEGVVRLHVYDDGLCDAYRSFQRLQQPHFFGDGVWVPDQFWREAKGRLLLRWANIKAFHNISSLSKSSLKCCRDRAVFLPVLFIPNFWALLLPLSIHPFLPQSFFFRNLHITNMQHPTHTLRMY